MEEWRGLGSDYPGYAISSQGRLRVKNGDISRAKPNKAGYVRTSLADSNGKLHPWAIHAIVATIFLGIIPGKDIVNHINGNRSDNRLENLEWVTVAENQKPEKKLSGGGQALRPVVQYSREGVPLQIWDSLTSAAVAVRGAISTISGACRLHTVTPEGFQWRYYDEVMIVPGEMWSSCVYDGVVVEVSSHGRAVSQKDKVKTYGHDDGRGYRKININRRAVFVHRLVCLTFKPIENPEKYVVNHIDNDSTNNHFSNLEWVTQQLNVMHAQQFKQQNTRPVNQYDLSGNFLQQYPSIRKAAKDMECQETQIINVCRGNLTQNGGVHSSCHGYKWRYAEE
jgi:hypothetical protein